MTMTRLAPLVVLALLGLAACQQKPGLVAPRERGVCYYVVKTGETYRFDRIASNVASIEYCAAELERMKMGLARLGREPGDITGAYQGQFLFHNKYGIYTAQKFEGQRYLLMVRYNGKLVVPGAVPMDK
jgi:hypothetical protein